MSGAVDAQIVERARKGDDEAREELVREAARRLYPAAYRIVRDRDLADDAVQRTLVTIWKHIASLREVEKYEAWSYRVMMRYCHEELRKRRQLGVELADPEHYGSAEDRTAQVGLRDQLERAFRRLSVEHRAVVLLVYFEGLSGAEAAATLGVSAGTVASRLHYALKSLRAAIEADERPGLLPLNQPQVLVSASR